MKKIVLFLIVLAAAFPCAAQKNPIKWLKGLRRPARTAPVAPKPLELRTVQGKKLPAPAHPVLSHRQKELETFVARQVRQAQNVRLPFATTPHSAQQARAFVERYREAMAKFKKFKQETTPFLYYRIKDAQKMEAPRREDQHFLPAALDMERELLRVSAVIDAKEDDDLAFALSYVARVRDELAPILKGMSGTDLFFSRTDRKFVGDEFYLYEFELKRWTDMFRGGQAAKQARQLPRGLCVAVLNDRASVLEQMQKSHEKGVFIRGGEVDGFLQADELIAAVRAGKKYDLILTDIIVPGGGGYYLTKVLRLDGFSGAIIALSAFERDDSMAMDMFERGFDGMLNLPIAFEYSPFWEADVMRGINKYFRLKQENDWLH